MDYKALIDALNLPNDSPVVGVEAQLMAALDRAGDEFAGLEAGAVAYIEGLADLAVRFKQSVVAAEEHAVALEQAHALFENPWFRHGAEIELARLAVSRSSDAMSRWLDLQPIIAANPLPDSAAEYAEEMTHAYLFGFDAACVAFCSSTLERVLADALVQVGEYKEAQLRRERPTAHTLIAKAKRRGLLVDSVAAAAAVAGHRNKVLHRRLWDRKSKRGVALSCVEKFAQVLGELEQRLSGAS